MPKKLILKVHSPVDIEVYEKDYSGTKIQVRREACDDWNEISLTVPDGISLPANRAQFSVKALGLEHDILDVSDDTHIQSTVISIVTDEDIQEELAEHSSNDDWCDTWELIHTDYIVADYEILTDDA